MDSDDDIYYDEDCNRETDGSQSGIGSLNEDIQVEFEDIKKNVNETNQTKTNYKILSIEEIFQYMTDFVEDLSNVTEIPPEIVRILSTHFRWRKGKLMDRFFDGDQEELFSEVGVINPFIDDSCKRNLENPFEECIICLSVQPASQVLGLRCGHRFCTDCWRSYLTIKIWDEGVSQTLTCASTSCQVLVDDASVMKLTDSKVWQRYRQLILNKFVENNEKLRWCPAPDCVYAIKTKIGVRIKVTCRCNHSFCFSCGENWHEAIKCDMFKKWIKTCDSDGATSSWLVTNTKDCPKCKTTIEKNGGCNHITCKQCQTEFCWVCHGPWELHGNMNYQCNVYDHEESKTARDAFAKSRSELRRLVFFSSRYKNHKMSRDLEFKLHDTIEKIMRNTCWVEVPFLKNAIDTLCQCRETLMSTYVLGYYLEKNNETLIFEDNQKDLETSTETLSEYLEKDLSSESLAEILAKLKHTVVYCETRRMVLLEHMEELIRTYNLK